MSKHANKHKQVINLKTMNLKNMYPVILKYYFGTLACWHVSKAYVIYIFAIICNLFQTIFIFAALNFSRFPLIWTKGLFKIMQSIFHIQNIASPKDTCFFKFLIDFPYLVSDISGMWRGIRWTLLTAPYFCHMQSRTGDIDISGKSVV